MNIFAEKAFKRKVLTFRVSNKTTLLNEKTTSSTTYTKSDNI